MSGTWLLAIAAGIAAGLLATWVLDDVIAGLGAGLATLVILRLVERVGGRPTPGDH